MPEVALDRGQRHRHDHAVEHDEQVGGAEQREREAAQRCPGGPHRRGDARTDRRPNARCALSAGGRDTVPPVGGDAAIEAVGLTKRYGAVTAVDDLSFRVREASVTGFLGPNGAGKTTTLRMVLGLARPTAGRAVIEGRRYADVPEPARTVGANLEVAGAHPGRSGRDHLRALAAMAGIPRSRVEEVLRLVELDGAAGRRAGKYSLGMRQRLGLAATLLGDPRVLVLDEPANGLDPQGIRWLRDFLRGMAGDGRTVLVSSHVLAEVAQTVDDVVVIHRGRLVEQGPVSRLTGGGGVLVRTPRGAELGAALAGEGLAARETAPGELVIDAAEAARVGDIAFRAGVPLHLLMERSTSLEEAFLALTSDAPAALEGGDPA
jgi:ABC-2 type transport system ATP-binding protein